MTQQQATCPALAQLSSSRCVACISQAHHALTLLLCHLLYVRRSGTGLAHAAVNLLVHAIMYSYYALTQLAQTTMRSEIGKLTLDETFLEALLFHADAAEPRPASMPTTRTRRWRR